MNNDAPASPASRKPANTSSVTMATVGRLAGVSQVTVSRALSDPSKVSPATLARIREAIEQTGFVPNAVAGALASRRSSLITAIVPSITNIVYSGLLHGFSDIMRGAGYQIMVSESGFDPKAEEALTRTLLSRRPDGMLLIGIHHTAATRRMLLSARIPVAEVWDISETPIDFCVGFSHAEAGRAAAEFALSGRHRTALTITAADERAHRRRAAFAQRFEQAEGARVVREDRPGPATLSGGREAMAHAIDGQGMTTGVIFCSSDQLAHGAMIEASARGFRIPEDFAVIGFGDQEYAAAVEPPLTTVRVDRERLGRTAAETLQRRIADEELSRSVIDLGFDIVRRKST